MFDQTAAGKTLWELTGVAGKDTSRDATLTAKQIISYADSDHFCRFEIVWPTASARPSLLRFRSLRSSMGFGSTLWPGVRAQLVRFTAQPTGLRVRPLRSAQWPARLGGVRFRRCFCGSAECLPVRGDSVSAPYRIALRVRRCGTRKNPCGLSMDELQRCLAGRT
jgi:hypothetical protein